MRNNVQELQRLSDVVVGDKWSTTITFSRASTDFTTVAITCKLRSGSTTGSVVYTFSPVAAFPDPADLTTFTTDLTLTGANTTSLGTGTFYGDVVLSMTGFGPYTPLQFSFRVTTRITT